MGKIHYDSEHKFYLTHGLGGHHVGLLRVGAVVRVWFYHLLLGSFSADGLGKFRALHPCARCAHRRYDTGD